MRDILQRRWGCTFATDEGSFHSFRDLGLLPAAPPNFGEAEPDIQRLLIPGASGGLDLSEALTGYITYRDRAPELLYYLTGSEAKREALRRQAAAALHGRLVRITPDESPEGYWYGRLRVEAPLHDMGADTITITGDLDPYKYDQRTTAETWLWDPFNFETGVIREYGGISVNGTKTVTVVSSPMGGSPSFVTDSAMTMKYNGKTYSLSAGSNQFAEIELPHAVKEVSFTFTGTGTVSIGFQGGSL